MKKTLSVILSLVMMLSIIAMIPFTATATELTGDGSAENPYLISDYAGLKAFAEKVNCGEGYANAKLTGNIVADDAEWTPIGNGSSGYYYGTFDGDGHKITGLTTPDDYGDYAGLFGYVSISGVIQNVGLEGGNINGNYNVGGIVGDNSGTIRNCYNTGTVNGKNSVGGVVGHNYFGTVQNCYNTETVKGDYFVGGTVGDNLGTIQNCYNTGTVDGSDTTGGIVGYNLGAAGYTAKITDCYNVGGVTGENGYVGGIVGFNFGTNGTANVTNCYNLGAVTGTGDSVKVGGIVGCHKGYVNGNANVTDCYSIGPVTGTGIDSKAGGIIGCFLSDDGGKANVTNCCFDRSIVTISGATDENNWKAIGENGGDTTEINVKGLTTAEMTGTDALTNIGFSDTSVWLVKADGNDDSDGKYYWFYPHLKGFNFNTNGENETSENITPADWPAKAEAAVSWSEPESYTCNGSELAPTVSSLTVGGAALTADTDYSLSLYKHIDSSYDKVSEAVWPSDYKAVVSFTASGHADIEKGFTIKAVSPEITVTATEYVKVGEDVTITVNYPSDAYVISGESSHGSVTIKIDGLAYETLWGENGTAMFCIPTGAFDIGEHTVEGVFNGDLRKYESNSDTATFTVVSGSYKITFVNFDGTELQSGDVEFGETPVYTGETPIRETDDSYIYEFDKWDKDIEAVTGETTYTATYKTTAVIPFPDVSKDDWFFDAVQYCARKGFIGGYSDGNFGPADSLKRQDFVVILARIAGADLSSYTSCKLTDVKMNTYYGKAVAWAVDNGYVHGYENGKFGVGDNITREQVATILYRYADSPEIENIDSTLAKFKDVKKISGFAKTPLAWAVQNGVISGMADGRVAPTEGASRAQIAVIITNMDKQGMFKQT